jgi:hypothetical protein
MLLLLHIKMLIFSTCSKGCTIALSLIASLMVNKKYIMPYIYAFSFFYLVHSHAISALSRYYLFYMSGVWVFPHRTCHKQMLYIMGLNYCAQSPRIYHFSHNMYSHNKRIIYIYIYIYIYILILWELPQDRALWTHPWRVNPWLHRYRPHGSFPTCKG